MPTNEQDQQNNGSTGETQGQEPQGQQQQTTPEPGANGQQQQQPATLTVDDSTQLPDTHPLVKAYGLQKGKIGTLTTELAEARAQSGKATKLQEELDARPTTEAMNTLQTRYDRLEAFVLAVGLGKALDSRTFTKDLFETDKDIQGLVKDWNKANPSATSQALGAGGGQGESSSKRDPNELLRIAAGKQ